MIVQESTTTVSFSEEMEEIDYEIAATPEAFRILSRGIYSNPIKAVLRELGTNAIDGHIALAQGVYDDDGNVLVQADPSALHKQFEVTLPTSMSPTLVVRDYGCGLSNAQIRKLYRTYFASSKRNSNAFNGSLGLGSKTPFAVASTFSVVSYYQNTKSIYTVMIGSNGKPTIIPVAEGIPDNTPSGMEITVPIDSNDISKFPTAAFEIYRWFNNPPKILYNNSQIDRQIESHKNSLVSENLAGLDIKRAASLDSSVYVLQANVLYPVDVDILSPLIDDAVVQQLITQLEHSASSCALIIEVENGSVQFTASRESLEYNEWTISNLKKIMRDWYDQGASQYKADKDRIEKLTGYERIQALEVWGENADLMGALCYSQDPIKCGDIRLESPRYSYSKSLAIHSVTVKDLSYDRSVVASADPAKKAEEVRLAAASRSFKIINSTEHPPSHLMGSIQAGTPHCRYGAHGANIVNMITPPRIIVVDDNISVPALRRAVGALRPVGPYIIVQPHQTNLINSLVSAFGLTVQEAVQYSSKLERVKVPRRSNSSTRLTLVERIDRDCTISQRNASGNFEIVEDVEEFLDGEYETKSVLVLASGKAGSLYVADQHLPSYIDWMFHNKEYLNPDVDVVINMTRSQYERYKNHIPAHLDGSNMVDALNIDAVLSSYRIIPGLVEYAQVNHPSNKNYSNWNINRYLRSYMAESSSSHMATFVRSVLDISNISGMNTALDEAIRVVAGLVNSSGTFDWYGDETSGKHAIEHIRSWAPDKVKNVLSEYTKMYDMCTLFEASFPSKNISGRIDSEYLKHYIKVDYMISTDKIRNGTNNDK